MFCVVARSEFQGTPSFLNEFPQPYIFAYAISTLSYWIIGQLRILRKTLIITFANKI
jgi:hypothetical protein